MKIRSLIFFFAFASTISAKADTLDYWHIYYNDFLIKKCNQFHCTKLILESKDLKQEDSIKMKYCRDTPCYDCKGTIKIESENDSLLLESSTIGTCSLINFSIKDILKKHEKGKFLNVYYEEELSLRLKKRFKSRKIFMLKIWIED